jgi:PEP-CTERM motif
VLSETGEAKVFEEWVGEASVFGFEILPQPSERLCLKNLAGALHTDGGGCTLSVGREGKMGILDNWKPGAKMELASISSTPTIFSRGEIKMPILRKGLIVAALAGLTLGAVGIAHADAIPAATPLDPVYKFTCCGGATGVTDLDVVYSLDVSGDKNFTFTQSLLTPPCTPVVDGASATLICAGGINMNEVILETVPAGATIVSSCYSVPLKSACITTTGTPVPEPATGGLMLLGFGMLMLLGLIRYRSAD